MKTLLTLSLFFLFFVSLTAQNKHEKIYRTTADGTWTGENWTPAPPPTNLTNATVIIEHKIEYIAESAILNWNSPTGQIIIEQAGNLYIKTEDSKLVQSKGFKLINNGKLKIDLGTSSIKVEKGSPFINNGTISLVAGIVDLNQEAFAQLISKPKETISAVSE